MKFYAAKSVALALAFATSVFGLSVVQSADGGSFVLTGWMNTARAGHTATLLTNGMVLATGGLIFTGGLSHVPYSTVNSTETYDPTTGQWSDADSMNIPREDHTATLLSNGMVLVAGGTQIFGILSPMNLSSAELYNPATGQWTNTGSMTNARVSHTATLLTNGLLLVAGGGNASAELYDPATGEWTSTGSMSVARMYHTATLLTNGMVLVAGGETNSAELYDPGTERWAATGSMNVGRVGHTATLLTNGMVLVAGGGVASAELYDPATGEWTLTGLMTAVRVWSAAALLTNGTVLVAGGETNSAEIYNPATGKWTNAGVMAAARSYYPAVSLPDGRVLLAGGYDFATGGVFSSAELYSTNTTPVAGSLQVTLEPAGAVHAGAQWQLDTSGTFYNSETVTNLSLWNYLDNSGAFYNSGTVVTDLSPGIYTVQVSAVTGWTAPASQTITIANGVTTKFTGIYAVAGQRPVVTIASPKSGQSVPTPTVTVTGTTSRSTTIVNLLYQLNGGGWFNAVPINHWSNWTASITPASGSNTLQAYAVDTSTVYSLTNTVRFLYISSATLTVQTNGSGSINTNYNGKLLAIGTNYALTASPGKNWIFSNWVASGSETFVSNNPVLAFTMQSNLVLQANFVTNPFLAVPGNYYGLFIPTNAARQNTNSGAITFDLLGSGSFSGTLLLGPDTVKFSSNFNVGGAVQILSTRKGKSNLTTTLQLDFAGQLVTGQVSDGSFVAQVWGYPDVFSASHPATNYEGSYTLIIPGANDPTVGPLGAGYGTVTVDAKGNITFGGSLADGTSVSQSSVAVSRDGYWPFYLQLYGGSGSFWAWNQFTNGSVNSLPMQASWINVTNSAKGAVNRAGFTNEAAQLIGSGYNAASKPLLALANGMVLLEGGNLASGITNQILFSTNNTITVTNVAEKTNKLVLTITKKSGLISGTFANPSNAKQTITVNGVLMQNQTNAAGYFLGTNQSGLFELMGP